MSDIDLSLVLAAYNEAGHLDANVAAIIEVLERTRFSYEIIFVDDCSQDGTRNIINEQLEKYPGKRVKKLFHEENSGRGKAVTDGFRMAEGTVIGYIDVDLEIGAHYIPSFVSAILRGADVAVAERIYKFYLGSMDRYIHSKGYHALVRRVLDLPLLDTESGYKFFRKDRLRLLLESVHDPGWFWDTEIMDQAYRRGFRIEEIPCLYLRRLDKRSTVRPLKDSWEYFWKLLRYRRNRS